MNIDEALVARLVATQFPQWADLPVTPVEFGGWDNRTFHLGADMSVRLPSGQGYSEQAAKEHRWLPVLAPQLPLPIPTPLAMGEPAEGYPWNWSVYRWLDGDRASHESIDDLTAFATALADFLVALQQIDATDGPRPGTHNFYRGAPLTVYEAEALAAIDVLGDEIDVARVTDIWAEAMAAPFTGRPVWLHGDVSEGNLLVTGGRLGAVIDFGSSGVGDPACDLVIAWTFLAGESREAFRAGVGQDAGTWARARGWALWKALITLAADFRTDPARAARPRRDIAEILADHPSS